MHFLVAEGHMYFHGSSDCKQDYTKAAALYSKAAQNGNAEGIYNLAIMTIKGQGVKINIKLGVEMLEKASKLPGFLDSPLPINENIGVKEAQHYLGLLHQHGVFYKKNLKKAKEYYEIAIKNGSGYSANNLGIMFLDGEGVERDLKKAEMLFLNAAGKQDPNAYMNLTKLYIYKKDPFKAEESHKKSKDRKNMYSIMEDSTITKAINELKIMYREYNVSDEELIEFEKNNGYFNCTSNSHDKINKNNKNLTKEERLDRYFKNQNESRKIISNIIEDEFAEFEKIPKDKFLIKEEIKTEKPSESAIKEKLFYCSEKFDPVKLMAEHAQNPSKTTERLIKCLENLNQVFDSLNFIDTQTKFSKNTQNYFRDENSSLLSEIILKIKIALEAEISICESLYKYKTLLEPLTDSIINKQLSNDLDIGARLLKFYLNFHQFETNIKFLKLCIHKYPKYSLFYFFLGSMMCYLGKYEDSLNIYEKGLRIDPKNTDILYNKAAACRIIQKSETIAAYEAFLSKADKKDRKYPEALYVISVYLSAESAKKFPVN